MLNRLLLLFLFAMPFVFHSCSKEDQQDDIMPANQLPVIEAPSSVSAVADSLFTLQLEITDPDGPVPVVSFEGLPDWLSYDAAAQVLSGTPARSDQGNVTIDIIAADDIGQRKRTLKIAVLVYLSITEKLNNEVTSKFQFTTSGMLGVSVALMTPEDELITTTRGQHSPGGNNPLDPNYRYRVASVTKSFTATLILRLAEEGYFELDDKLFEYLEIPGLDNGIAITIEHLLTHTSGMGDHLNDGGFYTGSDWQTRVWEHQDIYDYTVDQGSFFWPGSSYRYSNTGFYVLGALAEAVTGQSLSDLYKSYIFNPLGLDQTLYDDFSSDAEKIDSLAENSRAYEYHLTSVGAAGAIVSTPSDLAKYGNAVYGGDFLTAASKELMITDYGFAVGGSNYGLGTRLWDDFGIVHYGHTGSLMDYRSIIMYVPEADVSIALSTNDPHPNWFDLVNGVLVVVTNHYR
jgi:CubicO group peptidase (beta-lactamase class C family)